MSDFRNKFSWSVSRDSTFLECARQYYYRYYGYWGGWELNAPRDVREIYILKQLKNRHMWIGQIVHECIKRSLENVRRGIRVLPVEEILSITRDLMRTDFRSSRGGAYRADPKRACGLIEHEYDWDVPDQRWRDAADQVDLCLQNFYKSETYQHLCEIPADDFVEIEQLSRIRLDDVDVIIKLDCAVREPARLVIWDWKTGRRESTSSNLQLACYAYYASTTYGVPIHSVVTRRYELFSNTIHEDTLGERALGELLGYIRGSIKDMHSLLDDVAENTASESRFKQVNNPDYCKRCSFLKICKPDLPANVGTNRP